jgi:hypothetical protein
MSGFFPNTTVFCLKNNWIVPNFDWICPIVLFITGFVLIMMGFVQNMKNLGKN